MVSAFPNTTLLPNNCISDLLSCFRTSLPLLVSIVCFQNLHPANVGIPLPHSGAVWMQSDLSALPPLICDPTSILFSHGREHEKLDVEGSKTNLTFLQLSLPIIGNEESQDSLNVLN